MAVKRVLSVNKMIFALIITLLVFITIFLVSYAVSYSQYQKTSREQTIVISKILNFNIKNSLLGQSCTNFVSNDLSLELDHMGNILNLLEERLGKNNLDVLEQKKLYTSIEAEHFVYVRNYNHECDKEVSTVLFFYSNLEPFSRNADSIGYVLSSIKANRNQEIMIYSFDYDLDSEATRLLKGVYNVNQPNSLVINEDNVLVDVAIKSEIEKYL